MYMCIKHIGHLINYSVWQFTYSVLSGNLLVPYCLAIYGSFIVWQATYYLIVYWPLIVLRSTGPALDDSLLVIHCFPMLLCYCLAIYLPESILVAYSNCWKWEGFIIVDLDIDSHRSGLILHDAICHLFCEQCHSTK